MAMKYIRMVFWLNQDRIGFVRNFKWEWRVDYEHQVIPRNGNSFWESMFRVGPSRRWARIKKQSLQQSPLVRNVVIKRRLVQANWEDYHDSFGWKSGCGQR